MNFTDSDIEYGVSVIIGAMLIISIAVLGLSLYQADVVPKQEEAAEIEHHRLIVEQHQDLNTKVRQAASGSRSTVNLKLGLTYGSPTSIFVNSPPSSGTLVTNNFENQYITINNADGLDRANVYWNTDVRTTVGTPSSGVEYQTSFLRYSPQYYHYQSAPDLYMNYGILYKEYRDGKRLVISDQNIVNGKNINLIMQSGDISLSSAGSATVEVRPVSASDNSISITDPNGNNQVYIALPTRLSEENWVNILQDQACSGQSLTDGDTTGCSGSGNNHITEVTKPSSNIVEIYFEQGVTYDLSMAEVYLTTRQSTSQVPDTEALYASWVGSDDITIREGSTVGVPATALDKYNNPVDGARTTAEAVESPGNSPASWPDDCFGGYQSASNYRNGDNVVCDNGDSTGTFLQRGIDVSDNEGSVNFVYRAPEVSGDVSIEFRVCLGKYLDESTGSFTDPDGGSYSECQDVDGNRGT